MHPNPELWQFVSFQNIVLIFFTENADDPNMVIFCLSVFFLFIEILWGLSDTQRVDAGCFYQITSQTY